MVGTLGSQPREHCFDSSLYRLDNFVSSTLLQLNQVNKRVVDINDVGLFLDDHMGRNMSPCPTVSSVRPYVTGTTASPRMTRMFD